MILTLTKSMVRLSWAASLFGAQQFVKVLTPLDSSEAPHKTTEPFDALTRTIEDQFDDITETIFRVSTNQPKGLFDVVSSFVTLRAFNPNQIEEMSDILEWIVSFGQEVQGDTANSQKQSTGWVPMSSPDAD